VVFDFEPELEMFESFIWTVVDSDKLVTTAAHFAAVEFTPCVRS
jgi:hypothetical protein